MESVFDLLLLFFRMGPFGAKLEGGGDLLSPLLALVLLLPGACEWLRFVLGALGSGAGLALEVVE